MAEDFKRPPQREPLAHPGDYISSPRSRRHFDVLDIFAAAIVIALLFLFVETHADWIARMVGQL